MGIRTSLFLFVFLVVALVNAQTKYSNVLKKINEGINKWDLKFRKLNAQNVTFGPPGTIALPLTIAEIDSAVDSAIQFLLRMQNADGTFQESYDLSKKQYQPASKKLAFREAGTLWSLARVWSSGNRQPALTNAIQRGLQYFLSRTRVTPPLTGMYLGPVGQEKQGDIGAVGFLLATLADLVEADSRSEAMYIPYISKLTVFLMSMLDDKGRFFYNYNFTDGSRLDISIKHSVSGKGSSVAFMALTKVIKQIKDYQELYPLLPRLEKSLFKYWIGTAKDVKEARSAGFQEYYFGTARNLAVLSLSKARVIDSYGPIVHSLNYAYYLLKRRVGRVPSANFVAETESLVNSFHIAFALGLPNAVPALRKYFVYASRSLLQFQFGPPRLIFSNYQDKFAEGGCVKSLSEPIVHLSATQHFIHALLLTKSYGKK